MQRRHGATSTLSTRVNLDVINKRWRGCFARGLAASRLVPQPVSLPFQAGSTYSTAAVPSYPFGTTLMKVYESVKVWVKHYRQVRTVCGALADC